MSFLARIGAWSWFTNRYYNYYYSSRLAQHEPSVARALGAPERLRNSIASSSRPSESSQSSPMEVTPRPRQTTPSSRAKREKKRQARPSSVEYKPSRPALFGAGLGSQMVCLTGLQITGVEETPSLPTRETASVPDASILSAPPDTLMRMDDEDVFKMAAFGRNLATIAQTPSASSSSPLREPVRQASAHMMSLQKNFSTPFLGAPREPQQQQQQVALNTVQQRPPPPLQPHQQPPARSSYQATSQGGNFTMRYAASSFAPPPSYVASQPTQLPARSPAIGSRCQPCGLASVSLPYARLMTTTYRPQAILGHSSAAMNRPLDHTRSLPGSRTASSLAYQVNLRQGSLIVTPQPTAAVPQRSLFPHPIGLDYVRG